MKKIYFLIISLFLLLPLNIKAAGIPEYYIDATVLSNGDLKVKEIFYLSGDYNGFERIINYKGTINNNVFTGDLDSFKGSSIYNGDNIIIDEIAGVKYNNKISLDFNETDKTVFNKVNSASSGDYGKYTITNNSRGYNIRIYNPDRKGNAFYLEYTIKNIGIVHNDVAEIGWNLFDELSESVGNLVVTIHIPNNKTDLRVWAHGPLYGESKIINKQTLELTISNFDAYTKIDTRFTFDKEVLSESTKITNVDALDKIIKVETEIADEANQKREEYYKMLESEAKEAVVLAEKELTRETYNNALSLVNYLKESELKTELENRLEVVLEKVEEKEKRYTIIGITVDSIFLIVLGYLVLNTYKKHDKEYKSLFNNKYYRDIPNDYPPSTVGYLINREIRNEDLSACILNLINKKIITFEKDTEHKNNYILRTKKIENMDEYNNLNEADKLLYDMLFDGKQETSLRDLKYYARKKYEKFLRQFTNWKNKSLEIAKNEKFYENKALIKTINSLFCILGIFIGLLNKNLPILNIFNVLVIISSIAALIYFLVFIKRTKKGNEDYRKWIGLRNFMKDFGRMDEKDLPEIHLWEKYLVYAVTLGCADTLAKTMKLKLQELNEVDVADTMIDIGYINAVTSFNRVITTSINSAVSSAYSAQAAASSSSSGSGHGGGFSGGFSGGGSFGGGGGGGRF